MKDYNFFFLVISLFLFSCNNFPKDPEETLRKVTNDTLIVGYSENSPWVIKTESEPEGLEPAIVKAYAKTLNATVKWHNNTEQNLFKMLEERKIHLVIAGITQNTPWEKKAGLTRPYLENNKEKHVMAVINGENAFLLSLEKFLHEHKGKYKKELEALTK